MEANKEAAKKSLSGRHQRLLIFNVEFAFRHFQSLTEAVAGRRCSGFRSKHPQEEEEEEV